ncbi:MAG: hypothetical protein GY805_31895 [Chloroflexi bacterium]|nr:hypothetical protein [Chloroflexota bacterium]
MMLQKLRSQSDLIVSVAKYQHQVKRTIEQYKAIVQLVDGSRLHINEVWIDNELIKYSYYHLTPSGVIVQGWDNAPHHPDVATHPHHLHEADTVQESQVRCLDDVLTFLGKQVGG